MAENAIKAELPGKEGEMLSKMTEEVIVGGSKALGQWGKWGSRY